MMEIQRKERLTVQRASGRTAEMEILKASFVSVEAEVYSILLMRKSLAADRIEGDRAGEINNPLLPTNGAPIPHLS